MSHTPKTDVCRICERNISSKKYEKLQNCVYLKQELNRFVLGKGLFTSIKGHLSLTKRQVDNPEGQVKVALLINLRSPDTLSFWNILAPVMALEYKSSMGGTGIMDHAVSMVLWILTS